jgi:nucleoside-diphosphate-sugar epimerase
LSNRDALIVTAAITRLRGNTFEDMLKNIQMAENLSRLLTERQAGHVVFMSSVDVYGIQLEGDHKINEKLELNPNDYYAISKATSEFILKMRCSKNNIPLTVMRLSGVYGPGDGTRSTVGTLVMSAIKNKTVCIYGSGGNLRDYVFVDDIYSLVKKAIEYRINITVNVATEKSYSILQIVDIIKTFFPEGIEVEFKHDTHKGEKRIENMLFDCTKLRKYFPDSIMTDLKDGIAPYISYAQRLTYV